MVAHGCDRHGMPLLVQALRKLCVLEQFSTNQDSETMSLVAEMGAAEDKLAMS